MIWTPKKIIMLVVFILLIVLGFMTKDTEFVSNILLMFLMLFNGGGGM